MMADQDAAAGQSRLTAEFRRLNDLFYADPPPSAYFWHRLDLLLFTTYAPEKLTGLELDFQRDHLRVGRPAQPDLDEEDRTTLSRVATVEATLLLHHVAETLLRLYLAHEPISPCPWLRLAGLTNFWDFKEAVRTTFCAPDAPAGRAAIAAILRVFAGSANRKTLELSTRQWTKHRARAKNTHTILTHLAHLVLEEAPLYNAAKHGMAINPGAAFAFIDAYQVGNGPSITYLEVKQVKEAGEKLRQYRMTTAWINLELAIALIHWACALMETLWSVAKARYGEGPGTIQFHDLPEVAEALKAIQRHSDTPLRSRMAMPVGVVERLTTA